MHIEYHITFGIRNAAWARASLIRAVFLVFNRNKVRLLPMKKVILTAVIMPRITEATYMRYGVAKSCALWAKTTLPIPMIMEK